MQRGKSRGSLFLPCIILVLALFPLLQVPARAQSEGYLSQPHARFASTWGNGKPDCPEGTLFAPAFGSCLPVNDVRNNYRRGNSSTTIEIMPDLIALRNEKNLEHNREPNGMPTPGGLGAGIQYNKSALQALNHSELYTYMFVYPLGVNPSGTLSWLYTTSTNRTEKTVEVVGIYGNSIGASGDLGIFDWSCSSDYPCPNGQSGPSWQWTQPFSIFQCNMTGIIDEGGDLQTSLYYDNESIQLDYGSPPLWENLVYLWNYCTSAWDLIYSHQFRVYQKDCSLYNPSDSGSCGWWGPILETFDNPEPQINELGFENTMLFHDGTWSSLSTSETTFNYPVSPWILFHLNPNQGYGTGNYLDPAPPTVLTNSATGISSISATLNGTVNANNSSTTVTFQYGLTSSYDNSVTASESPVTGLSDTGVSSTISGLIPNTNYHFRVAGFSSAGTSYGSDITFTTMPTYTVTASPGPNGTLDTSYRTSPQAVNYNDTTSFKFNAASGYHVASVSGCGGTAYSNADSAVGTYTYTTGAITSNCTVTAIFAINQYSIIGYTAGGGSITPYSATISYGGSQSFVIAPDSGNRIVDVEVDGVSQGAISNYTFSNIGSNHTISARFGVSSCPNLPVRIKETGATYSTLESAYAAASDGQTIQSQATDLFLIGNGGVLGITNAITLDGGYDCNYLSKIDSTLLHGSIEIDNAGSLTVDSFFIY
jgi:hypothetical protein